MAPISARSGLAALHAAVMLFGLAGLFGKLIPAAPMIIVAGRTCFASLALGAFLAVNRRPGSMRAADMGALAGMGVILALHWWTFFYAIQISTVAVGLLGYAAFPVFVTFLEPVFFNERLRRVDLATAVAVTAGLILVAWPIALNAGRTRGVWWGAVSGLLFAVLSLLNRKYVQRHAALTIACFQNSFACLVLLPALWWTPWHLTPVAWAMLVFLGVICTALAHALFIFSLKAVKTQLAGIVAALEPVYGILFAFLLLAEVPRAMTLLGGALIVGATCLAISYRQSL